MTCGGVVEQWVDVSADHLSFHYHGVAAGEENISDLRMLGNVFHQMLWNLAFELLFGSDICKLRPTKAVRTKRMTELTLKNLR